jgi:hypothetical protein
VRYTAIVPLATLAIVAACSSDSPTEVSRTVASSSEVVITEGAATPARVAPRRPSLSDAAASIPATLGGSSTTPLTLTPQSCSETAARQLVVTYTITGRQDNPASFKVNTAWTYDGSGWSGSTPNTVNVAPRAPRDPATVKQVTITVTNSSAISSGTSLLTVPTFDLVTTPQGTLQTGTPANVTVHVAFEQCAVTNTAPTLTLPTTPLVVEATSAAGAVVSFVGAFTATDMEDGDLTASVVCAPASGSTFPLGTTTVSCHVTDSGDLEASGTFTVNVVDTTPAFFTSVPTGTIQLIAADINGATLDVGSLGIAVEDVGRVSEPSTYDCDYIAGTLLEIGSTTTVSCTATDAIGNESDPSTFDVFVGLDVAGSGFLQPLRMSDPFSTHKRGSTIPHKFLPPTYADGTPATDLASGLRLVITHLDGTVEGDAIEVNDYSAGSTAWRYDEVDGQYIFNLKSSTAWDVGTWRTAVSYKGITLAVTDFNLKK